MKIKFIDKNIKDIKTPCGYTVTYRAKSYMNEVSYKYKTNYNYEKENE